MKRNYYKSFIALVAAAGLCNPAAAEVVSYTGPRIEIPDDSTTGTTVLVEVSGIAGTITDFNFSIDGSGMPTTVLGDYNAGLDHTSPSDLEISITSPDGKSAFALKRPALPDNARHFFYTVFDDEATAPLNAATGVAPFTAAFKPAQPFTVFNGIDPNGTWTVRVADMATSDTGGLSAFSLHITTGPELETPPPAAYVVSPPKNITSGYHHADVTLAGTVVDYGASVKFVRVRRIPPDANPDTIAWQLAALDGSVWTHTLPLDVGFNRIEVQAAHAAAAFGAISVRNIVRDEPIYNGPKPDFAYMDEFSAVKIAMTRDDGVLPLVLWNEITGYAYDAIDGWKTFTADFNGDGNDDLATITPFGDLWISWNDGDSFEGNFKSASGYVFDEYEGWGIFAGDFNGDGFDDVLQFAPGGHLYVGWSDGTKVAGPVFTSASGFTYLPNESQWVDAADTNGDARDDVVFIASNGDIWVATSSGTGFNAPVKWAATGFFRHNRGSLANPLNASEVFFGDFNGDGAYDAGYMDNQGAMWVARSTTQSFQSPEFWGNHGLIYAPYLGSGWNLFTADINADAMDDLLQINQFGDVLVAHSTGNSFRAPDGILTAQQMRHNILGPRRIFIGEFGH